MFRLNDLLKTLCIPPSPSSGSKEKKTLAKPDLGQILKTNPNLLTHYPELTLVHNLLSDQNASIKMRGEEFHDHLWV